MAADEVNPSLNVAAEFGDSFHYLHQAGNLFRKVELFFQFRQIGFTAFDVVPDALPCNPLVFGNLSE